MGEVWDFAALAAESSQLQTSSSFVTKTPAAGTITPLASALVSDAATVFEWTSQRLEELFPVREASQLLQAKKLTLDLSFEPPQLAQNQVSVEQLGATASIRREIPGRDGRETFAQFLGVDLARFALGDRFSGHVTGSAEPFAHLAPLPRQ
jgi:hypothetical protein